MRSTPVYSAIKSLQDSATTLSLSLKKAVAAMTAMTKSLSLESNRLASSMDLGNCKLVIDGKEFLITNVRIDFEPSGLKADVQAYLPECDTVYNHPNCKGTFCLDSNHEREKMSALNTVPKNLEQFLNDNYKALYQLGWVDTELNLTSEGKNELVNFLLTENIDAFGKVAQDKVQQIKKQEKESK